MQEGKVKAADLDRSRYLDLESSAEALALQCTLEEGAEPGIASLVQLEPGVMVVKEDRSDRDIAYREALSRKPVSRQRLLEVGELRGNQLGHRLLDQCMVGSPTEEFRGEHLLHEHAAQNVRGEAAVDELLDPERPTEQRWISGVERVLGVAPFQVQADHRRVGQRRFAVLNHRDQAKRAQFVPPTRGSQGHDRHQLVGKAFLQGGDDDLARVRREWDSVDLEHVPTPLVKGVASMRLDVA